MRVGIASFLLERAADAGATIDRLVTFGRQVESHGFAGIWVGDAMGRGEATLDPMLALACLCSVTTRIELGISVLQTPLRQPAELAHRAQTLNVLSQGRFRLGVGAGSTRSDFDYVGADFDRRFDALRQSISIMRGAWRGEPQNGVVLSPWQSNGSGPPILLGAWRSPGWIAYAAESCDGWIASGLFSKWDDLQTGLAAYRRAGGKRAILTNVPIDLRPHPEYADQWAEKAQVSFACPIDVARERLNKIERLGFDDLILVPPDDSPEHLAMAQELLRPAVPALVPPRAPDRPAGPMRQ
jgi:alkanesulfonate monooxygenase SsuD/methylene tetrahydromethanopterin reductase-like flavin-dependent oxidoreductase (luciferase family)